MNILSRLGESNSSGMNFNDLKSLVKTGLKRTLDRRLFSSSAKPKQEKSAKNKTEKLHLEKKLVFSEEKEIMENGNLAKNIELDSQLSAMMKENEEIMMLKLTIDPTYKKMIEKKKRKFACNCKKSKCLKLYCECFRKGVFCDEESCNCVECKNTELNKEFIKSIKHERKLEPKVFLTKLYIDPQGLKRWRGGCKCKRSGCQKKYCECYRAGATCGHECVCSGCKNCEIKPELLKKQKFSNLFESNSTQSEVRKPFQTIAREAPFSSQAYSYHSGCPFTTSGSKFNFPNIELEEENFSPSNKNQSFEHKYGQESNLFSTQKHSKGIEEFFNINMFSMQDEQNKENQLFRTNF